MWQQRRRSDHEHRGQADEQRQQHGEAEDAAYEIEQETTGSTTLPAFVAAPRVCPGTRTGAGSRALGNGHGASSGFRIPWTSPARAWPSTEIVSAPKKAATTVLYSRMRVILMVRPPSTTSAWTLSCRTGVPARYLLAASSAASRRTTIAS